MSLIYSLIVMLTTGMSVCMDNAHIFGYASSGNYDKMKEWVDGLKDKKTVIDTLAPGMLDFFFNDNNQVAYMPQSLLYVASERGHTNIVRLLLENGASTNPKASCLTPLGIASSYEHTAVVELLCEYGAQISEVSIFERKETVDIVEDILKRKTEFIKKKICKKLVQREYGGISAVLTKKEQRNWAMWRKIEKQLTEFS